MAADVVVQEDSAEAFAVFGGLISTPIKGTPAFFASTTPAAYPST